MFFRVVVFGSVPTMSISKIYDHDRERSSSAIESWTISVTATFIRFKLTESHDMRLSDTSAQEANKIDYLIMTQYKPLNVIDRMGSFDAIEEALTDSIRTFAMINDLVPDSILKAITRVTIHHNSPLSQVPQTTKRIWFMRAHLNLNFFPNMSGKG